MFGTTFRLAKLGTTPLFTLKNGFIVFNPEFIKPIEVLSLYQLYCVPLN